MTLFLNFICFFLNRIDSCKKKQNKIDKQEKSGLGKQSKSFLNCIFRGTAMYLAGQFLLHLFKITLRLNGKGVFEIIWQEAPKRIEFYENHH